MEEISADEIFASSLKRAWTASRSEARLEVSACAKSATTATMTAATTARTRLVRREVNSVSSQGWSARSLRDLNAA